MTVLERVRLRNVRNRDRLEIRLREGLNVLVGSNGAGKTSVLEAIHIALRGWSPRTRSLRDVVTRGHDVMRVELDLRSDGEEYAVAAGYDRSGERRVTRGGVELEGYERIEGELQARVFLPDHLLLVKGGPRRRRRYLDDLAAAARPAHRDVVGDYEEALRQRNSLLRRGIVGSDHRVWETILADRGLELVEARSRTLSSFSPRYAGVVRLLAGDDSGEPRLVYRTNTSEVGRAGYVERLAEERPDDRRRGYTRLGPHRDDMRFFLGERDLRDFGSQGEQRTCLLGLLLAERGWIEEETGSWPLLLLDDVMSELDAERRTALLAVLRKGGQSVITTTTTEYFPSGELATMNVVGLDKP